MKKKKLYLITTNYPNKGGDSVFVLPEISELVKSFDLTVICTSGKRENDSKHEGITYYYYKPELSEYKKLLYVLKYPFSKVCREDFFVILKKNRMEKRSDFWGRIRKSIEFYACGEEFYHFFKKYIDNGREREEAIFYTFWCNEYSLPLIIHSQKYPNYHLVTRLHGYDLYEERYLYGRQPFKEVINRGLDKLFFVADRPMQYYLKRHPELDINKAVVIRLGVDQIVRSKAWHYGKSAMIISCSNVIPLKRVEIIINALASLQEDICWIHFGTGECMSAIQKLAEKKLGKKKNITYSLKGYVPNVEIRRFYEENNVDCFLTTSSTEGCPVSVMEALAAGIPIIGTAVGEIPSMINGNGILLKENPSDQEVAEAILQVINMPQEMKMLMRKRSFEIWSEYYDAKKNAPYLAQKLLSL